jgi:beta-phosphoglucomutase-like phosphatase (HAD superfamily)
MCEANHRAREGYVMNNPSDVYEVYLDCDGVLIDSETPAFRACCNVMNGVLRSKGISHQRLPAELQDRFAGVQAREIVSVLAEEYRFDLTPEEIDRIEIKEQAAVIQALARNVQATPGVERVLAKLRDLGVLTLVVSSSALLRVRISLQTAGLYQWFCPEWIFSAKELKPPKAKPDPAIYLHAQQVLLNIANGYAPTNVRHHRVAIEDSSKGVQAAARAGMPVIGYIGVRPQIHDDPSERARCEAELLEAGANIVITDWEKFFPAWQGIVMRD